MIEHVIQETDSSSYWSQLTKMNYNGWSLLIKLKMQARYLWDTVKHGEVKFHDDCNALDTICSAIP